MLGRGGSHWTAYADGSTCTVHRRGAGRSRVTGRDPIQDPMAPKPASALARSTAHYSLWRSGTRLHPAGTGSACPVRKRGCPEKTAKM
jgi:hypothetical protein